MYFLLNEPYLLRGWQKLPYALVDERSGRTQFCRKTEMDVFLLCNGHVDVSAEGLSETERNILKELEKKQIIRPCAKGESLRLAQLYKSYDNRYIRTAHWSVTGRCNYRCKHCYMSAPDAKFGELSHEQVMDIVQQLIDCGIYEVTLTGGEPLVRGDFLEIVDALLDGGIHISTIYSNGKLVTEKLLDELEKRDIHPEFNMSFDGVGWHDWLRGIDGAEKYVTDAFLRCREHGFPTGAEMCIHRQNKHTLRESINYLHALGCRSLKTNPIANVGAWKEGGFGEAISMEELFQIYLDYIPQYYEDGMPLSLQLGGFFYASPQNPKNWRIPAEKNCSDPDKLCVCGHARMVMYISAEGRALPCMALSGISILEQYPLITEEGLKKCISDSSYMHLIETRASELLAHNPECQECEYAMRCLAGCRASALETSPQDILGRDMTTCLLFKGGWTDKIRTVMKEIESKARKCE
ncbi:MAG: radical SAM protein [Lachnospiraceae bacterium]|nr:radical SAM protein [Lachnospiraceae bacterium]